MFYEMNNVSKLEKINKTVLQILSLAYLFCHPVSTNYNESFNHEKLTFANKLFKFPKHWDGRIKLASLLHNLDYQTIIRKIYEKIGCGKVPKELMDNCQKMDDEIMKSAILSQQKSKKKNDQLQIN